MIIAILSKNQKILDTIRKLLVPEANISSNQIVGIPNLQLDLIEILGDIEQVRAIIEQSHPDLILLDSLLHDNKELQILNDIAEQYPDMGIILLSQNQSTEKLIEAMRVGVREILPLHPPSQAALTDSINRFMQRKKRVRMPAHKGKIFAFIPCKGGSGSTFIAANLAYVLAATEGKRVLLIDFNLQLGDASLFLSNDKPPATIADVARQIHRLDSNFLASSVLQVLPNLGILASPEEPEKSTEINVNHVNPILQVAVQNYDFVILDIGRRLDAITIQALDQSDVIFPVVQQTLPFIRDARRLLNLFRSLGYSDNKVRLIVNRYDKGSEITLDDVIDTLKTPVFKAIPNNYAAVEQSVNHGEPVLKLAPKSSVSKTLSEMGSELCVGSDHTSTWFKKIFS